MSPPFTTPTLRILFQVYRRASAGAMYDRYATRTSSAHLNDVPTGNYAARSIDVTDRTRTVRNIKIDPGAIISIAEKDVTSCEHH
jgi:hypothetical protein